MDRLGAGVSFSSVLVACALAACGCAGSDPECEPARKLDGASALPDEVDAIIEAKCRNCHSRPIRMYAPMPLVTWEDMQAPFPGQKAGPPVYALAHERIHNADKPMPPITQPQLSGEERAVIDAWVAQCAPAKKD